jgi:branched-chain amino acid transport system substrate-binding protein
MKALLILTAFISSPVFATDVPIGLASNFSEVSLSNSNPYGDYFRKGVQLAVQDSAEKLKNAHLNIVFQEFDYGTDQLRVLDAVKKATQSSVIAVVGYNLSPQALLAAPVHHEAQLPMITSSATANRLSTMGRYVHMGAFDNDFMGKTLARVAKERIKAKKVAIVVAEDCAYCHDLADTFITEFKRLHGEVNARIGVIESQHDFKNVISELKNQSVDAIIVPNYATPSARIIAAITASGINKPFLGGDGWGDFGDEFYKIMNGVKFTGYSLSHWHSDLATQASTIFKKEFVAANKKDPNDTAVLAYDSMKLLIDALLKTKTLSRDGIENALNSIHHFKGVTGNFVYRNINKAPEKSIVLLTTDKDRFKILDTLNPDDLGAIK